MDRYGNAIYLTPMVLGALASIFAAAWRFLGVRPGEAAETALEALCGLPGRIRKIDNEAELTAIEEEVDAILRTRLMESVARDEGAPDAVALIAAAHRLDHLIHQRRMALASGASPVGKAAEYICQQRGV